MPHVTINGGALEMLFEPPPAHAADCTCHVQGSYCPCHGEYNPVPYTEPHGDERRLGRGLDGCGGGRRVQRHDHDND